MTYQVPTVLTANALSYAEIIKLNHPAYTITSFDGSTFTSIKWGSSNPATILTQAQLDSEIAANLLVQQKNIEISNANTKMTGSYVSIGPVDGLIRHNIDDTVSIYPITTPAVLQVINSNVLAQSGTSTVIASNILPTVALGSQIWSQTITPVSPISKILLNGTMLLDNSRAGRRVFAFFFRGTTCIGAMGVDIVASGSPCPMSFNFIDILGDNLPAIYSIRVAASANTWYINQSSTASSFSGMYAKNVITLMELS